MRKRELQVTCIFSAEEDMETILLCCFEHYLQRKLVRHDV